MESESIRVRFAPSPGGLLHVGNARTALFNWLFARHSGGRFVVRIEDTDFDRSKTNYEKQLLQELVWLGMDWDEGPSESDASEKGDVGPYRQSKRMDIYATHTAQLLAEGKAYRCFCTPEELEEERQQAIAEGRPQVYGGRCRVMSKFDVKENLLRGRIYSIRLRIPDQTVCIHDMLRGDMKFSPETISDPILVRSAQGGTAGASPGVPVYHYVVAIDDALMGITHVIRADDHIANTPKQVAIYEAFGWKVPEYIHLPAIVGTDGERLSKRHGPTSMSGFREMGYLPEALVNYLATLGWSGEDAKTELRTPDQLVQDFSLERISASPAVFDFEKLNAINRQCLKLSPPGRLAAQCWDYFGGLLPEKEEASDGLLVWFFHMIAMFVPTVNRLGEIPAKAAFIFHMDPNLARADNENAAILEAPSTHRVFTELQARLRSKAGPISAADFNGWLKEIKNATGMSDSEVYNPVRIALTGTVSGPDFGMLIGVLEQGAALNIGIPSVGQRIAAFVAP